MLFSGASSLHACLAPSAVGHVCGPVLLDLFCCGLPRLRGQPPWRAFLFLLLELYDFSLALIFLHLVAVQRAQIICRFALKIFLRTGRGRRTFVIILFLSLRPYGYSVLTLYMPRR